MKNAQTLLILLFTGMILMTATLDAQTTKPTTKPSGNDVITVHYHRYDGNYQGVGLWTWDRSESRTPEEQPVRPVGDNDFGKVFYLDTSLYGITGEPSAIGFIPRLRDDWNYRDGPDRFWTPSLGKEIWLIGNDPEIYTEEPDVSPRLLSAKLDDSNVITLLFTHPLNEEYMDASKYHIVPTHGPKNLIPVSKTEKAGDNILHLISDKDLTLDGEYLVNAGSFGAIPVTRGDILFQKDIFYSDKEMGAVYSPEATTFRLFSPTAKAAWAIVYDELTGDKGRTEIELEYADKGVWEATVPGDHHGKHYMVKVDAAGPATNQEVPDIWAKNTTGRHARPMIVDPRRMDPPGFRDYAKPDNIKNPTDAVIWEVHTRDFTRDESSGVPANIRGKYKAATLRGTTVPGTDIKTGIDYLLELGVTHVQILPIHDFDNREDDDEYNWGYMTTNFNSPEGWFASEIGNESRIREFKEMVMAFHEAGIRVILDVVYNHTAPTATFESIAPGYYHRFRPDGSYWNGSGTGNEFHSESPMGRQFIVDSTRYWMEEYRLDGFRFDLMGLVDAETMQLVREAALEIDPDALVYGEPWAAAGSGLDQLTYKDVASKAGLGAFNDHFRNDIKGPPDGSDPGYVFDGRNRAGIYRGLRGSIADWAQSPAHALQYVTCHDNLSLWDKILYSAPDATPVEHMRMNQLSIGILAVSQGVMFLHAGSEFGYDKDGEHNSYNKPDSINSIKWDLRAENAELENFTKEMIAMRKAHPMFRMADRHMIEERTIIMPTEPGNDEIVKFMIMGNGIEGETWDRALIVVNPLGGRDVSLPEGDWKLEATNVQSDKIGQTMSGKIEVELKEMMVFSQ